MLRRRMPSVPAAQSAGRTRACVSRGHVPAPIVTERDVRLTHLLKQLLALFGLAHIGMVHFGELVELVLDLRLGRCAWELEYGIKILLQHHTRRVQSTHGLLCPLPSFAPHRRQGRARSGGHEVEDRPKFFRTMAEAARGRGIQALILDAAPLLTQARIEGLADKYYIPASVLAELRDVRAREYLEKLHTTGQISLEVREPSAEAMRKGRWGCLPSGRFREADR